MCINQNQINNWSDTQYKQYMKKHESKSFFDTIDTTVNNDPINLTILNFMININKL